ncbi:hypothetical protein EVAR_50251_1 [Eumeta japonica]|uniref:Uncharacterized protein n=1 Tax=Eumeta variegata TaxID=151549 RepID=A0A4C1YHC5_EUMVA|nr:hypothetical protein EVAR_50251_1 [Eumeta japonica]
MTVSESRIKLESESKPGLESKARTRSVEKLISIVAFARGSAYVHGRERVPLFCVTTGHALDHDADSCTVLTSDLGGHAFDSNFSPTFDFDVGPVINFDRSQSRILILPPIFWFSYL